MSRSERRGGGLARKAPTRRPYARVVVLCEGKNSEPRYIREFVRAAKRPLVDVEVIGPCGVPMTMVEEARRWQRELHKDRSSYSDRDKVFIVFDCDEHPRRKEALEEARKHAIGVAYSDPCFEVWAILHYRDFDSLVDRKEMQRLFAVECPSYSDKKGKVISFDAMSDKLEEARKRAIAMRKRRSGDGGTSPYTDVDLLLSYIESGGA